MATAGVPPPRVGSAAALALQLRRRQRVQHHQQRRVEEAAYSAQLQQHSLQQHFHRRWWQQLVQRLLAASVCSGVHGRRGGTQATLEPVARAVTCAAPVAAAEGYVEAAAGSLAQQSSCRAEETSVRARGLKLLTQTESSLAPGDASCCTRSCRCNSFSSTSFRSFSNSSICSSGGGTASSPRGAVCPREDRCMKRCRSSSGEEGKTRSSSSLKEVDSRSSSSSDTSRSLGQARTIEGAGGRRCWGEAVGQQQQEWFLQQQRQCYITFVAACSHTRSATSPLYVAASACEWQQRWSGLVVTHAPATSLPAAPATAEDGTATATPQAGAAGSAEGPPRQLSSAWVAAAAAQPHCDAAVTTQECHPSYEGRRFRRAPAATDYPTRGAAAAAAQLLYAAVGTTLVRRRGEAPLGTVPAETARTAARSSGESAGTAAVGRPERATEAASIQTSPPTPTSRACLADGPASAGGSAAGGRGTAAAGGGPAAAPGGFAGGGAAAIGGAAESSRGGPAAAEAASRDTARTFASVAAGGANQGESRCVAAASAERVGDAPIPGEHLANGRASCFSFISLGGDSLGVSFPGAACCRWQQQQRTTLRLLRQLEVQVAAQRQLPVRLQDARVQQARRKGSTRALLLQQQEAEKDHQRKTNERRATDERLSQQQQQNRRMTRGLVLQQLQQERVGGRQSPLRQQWPWGRTRADPSLPPGMGACGGGWHQQQQRGLKWLTGGGVFQKLQQTMERAARAVAPGSPVAGGSGPRRGARGRGTAATADETSAPGAGRLQSIFQAAGALERSASELLARVTDVEKRQEEKQQLMLHRFYRYLLLSLMEKEGRFTYYDFFLWRKGCLDYLRAAEEELQGILGRGARKLADLGWERMRPSSSPEFKEIEKHLKILSHFTMDELERDSAEHFSPAAIAGIAAAAETTAKEVRSVLMQHAIALTDRTWYMRLMELRRPIPPTFEDYALQAETDRPFALRLPYGEPFFNYEVEQYKEAQKHRRRIEERNARRRQMDRVECLYTPDTRLSYDRWARLPQFRLDPYSNFVQRLVGEPSSSSSWSAADAAAGVETSAPAAAAAAAAASDAEHGARVRPTAAVKEARTRWRNVAEAEAAFEQGLVTAAQLSGCRLAAAEGSGGYGPRAAAAAAAATSRRPAAPPGTFSQRRGGIHRQQINHVKPPDPPRVPPPPPASGETPQPTLRQMFAAALHREDLRAQQQRAKRAAAAVAAYHARQQRRSGQSAGRRTAEKEASGAT